MFIYNQIITVISFSITLILRGAEIDLGVEVVRPGGCDPRRRDAAVRGTAESRHGGIKAAASNPTGVSSLAYQRGGSNGQRRE
ncbi:MAG: hypothetical protein ACREE3_13750, partial [Stellaceae bacterium]